MPKELTLLEEFDLIMDLQFPDFVYSADSLEEKIAFCNLISSLTNRRMILIYADLFNYPFVIAGLRENHIETILKESGYNIKKTIFFNLSNTEFLKKVSEFIDELDRRSKTTEHSTRFKNILQYLKDNRFVI